MPSRQRGKKASVSTGKEVVCIDRPRDLSLFSRATEQRPYRPRAELQVVYLQSGDLDTPVPVSNDWPGSSFHAVVVSVGPCLSSARGGGKRMSCVLRAPSAIVVARRLRIAGSVVAGFLYTHFI